MLHNASIETCLLFISVLLHLESLNNNSAKHHCFVLFLRPVITLTPQVDFHFTLVVGNANVVVRTRASDPVKVKGFEEDSNASCE